MIDFKSLSREEKLKLYEQAVRLVKSDRLEAQRHGPVWKRWADDPVRFILDGLGQFREESWRGWRTVLKAIYGQPLDPETELPLFRQIAERDPPTRPVSEFWAVVGRRGGKTALVSAINVEKARSADQAPLRFGERARIACLAVDRDQAGVVFGYILGYFEEIAGLKSWVLGDLPRNYRSGPIVLSNRTEIAVMTNNFRAPRGRAIAAATFDEIAFWRSDESATPDIETYRAIQPSMGTIPNSLLVGISSPYRRKGLLYDKYKANFGKNSDDILVIKATTRELNPTFRQSIIDKAIDDDPEAAAAEYLAEFRSDLADYVPREVVETLIEYGVQLRPPDPHIQYYAFVDPSGGSRDSMTLGIAHRDGDNGVLDFLDEVRAPFEPSIAVERFAAILKTYKISNCTGDRYGGAWPSEKFAQCGIQYEPSELVKSDIYREFLSHMMSRKVVLLDDRRAINQLCSLERRTARGGRDSIDHPPAGHDDLANVMAGALLMVVGQPDKLAIWRQLSSS